MDSPVFHYFDPKVAQIYSIESALIFNYISYLNKKSDWIQLNFSYLEGQYPYMRKFQLRSAVSRLLYPTKQRPNLVVRKFMNGGYFYRPIAKQNKLLHCFDVSVAVQVGIEAAIVFQSISYWVKENWLNKAMEYLQGISPAEFDHGAEERALERARHYACYYTSVRQWLKFHPYISFGAAARAFSKLEKQGLAKRQINARKCTKWTLVNLDNPGELSNFQSSNQARRCIDLKHRSCCLGLNAGEIA